jgi:hypothetical protein
LNFSAQLRAKADRLSMFQVLHWLDGTILCAHFSNEFERISTMQREIRLPAVYQHLTSRLST